ncbi:MAG: DNA-processing protein DprA [Pseudomonadales bacterium]
MANAKTGPEADTEAIPVPAPGPEERWYVAALAALLGRREARRRLAHGSPAEVLAQASGGVAMGARLARTCRRAGVVLLTPADAAFPEPLRQIPDPPLALYWRGPPLPGERPGKHDGLGPVVAIIGARRCSAYGARLAETLAADLAALGCVIVSGLALGIDSAAHRGALAEGGRSLAVLGNGLGHVYPVANRGLAHELVAAGGALISEYVPWLRPRRHHFPERNRLISGLAEAVLVVEAGERSGTLITARMALEQGREVMAVPGPACSPDSAGCHRLLREGAALVERADDVLVVLGRPLEPTRLPGQDSAGRRAARAAPVPPAHLLRLHSAVATVPTTLDAIVAASGANGAHAMAGLLELELGGFVEQVPGGYIRRPPPS